MSIFARKSGGFGGVADFLKFFFAQEGDGNGIKTAPQGPGLLKRACLAKKEVSFKGVAQDVGAGEKDGIEGGQKLKRKKRRMIRHHCHMLGRPGEQ